MYNDDYNVCSELDIIYNSDLGFGDIFQNLSGFKRFGICYLQLHLSTWFNFISTMDKQLHPSLSVG